MLGGSAAGRGGFAPRLKLDGSITTRHRPQAVKAFSLKMLRRTSWQISVRLFVSLNKCRVELETSPNCGVEQSPDIL